MSFSRYDIAVLTLCRAVLQNEKPDENVFNEIDGEKLLRYVEWHSVSALACCALEKTDYFRALPADTQKRWTDLKAKTLRRTILMNAERAALLTFMEREGIWYMPLKGVILQDYYPQYGIRKAADNDILFDSSYSSKVRDYFLSRGYKAHGFGTQIHDEYLKEPIYNFEMHRELMDELEYPNWGKYYKNAREKLIKDEGNGYGYHFSPEDFYIYFIVHSSKHLTRGGTGIRTLIDEYVYRHANPQMDSDYLDDEFEKLGLAGEVRLIRSLSDKLFDGVEGLKLSDLTPREEEMLQLILSSGAYGDVGNRVENELKRYEEASGSRKKAVRAYIKERIMPTDESHKANYPFFYKHKWLMPVFMIYRAFRAVFLQPGIIFHEIKSLISKRTH